MCFGLLKTGFGGTTGRMFWRSIRRQGARFYVLPPRLEPVEGLVFLGKFRLIRGLQYSGFDFYYHSNIRPVFSYEIKKILLESFLGHDGFLPVDWSWSSSWCNG